MTITASGVINLTSVQTEHDGAAPISVSEYYRGVGVDATRTQTITSSGLAAFGAEQYQIRAGSFYAPRINVSGVYGHYVSADNGVVGTLNRQFTINVGGTYSYLSSFFCDTSGTRTASLSIQVNGSTVVSRSFSSSKTSDVKSGTFSVPDGATIRVIQSWTTDGWGNVKTDIGGNNYLTRSITTNVNETVPTSGEIKFSDFYSTTNY